MSEVIITQNFDIDYNKMLHNYINNLIKEDFDTNYKEMYYGNVDFLRMVVARVIKKELERSRIRDYDFLNVTSEIVKYKGELYVGIRIKTDTELYYLFDTGYVGYFYYTLKTDNIESKYTLHDVLDNVDTDVTDKEVIISSALEDAHTSISYLLTCADREDDSTGIKKIGVPYPEFVRLLIEIVDNINRELKKTIDKIIERKRKV